MNKVGFLHPGMITSDTCLYEKRATIDYLSRALVGYEFYLAPYLQGYHILHLNYNFDIVHVFTVFSFY